ncbi:MAG: LysR family transcriptional regulator [Lautropia sp.]
MLIDLVQLRTFVVAAEEQHLGRAAERLHISQSAASSHVRAIEDCLGTRLFVRARSLELTKAGQLLVQRAKGLLNEATTFTSFAREVRGKIEGTLVVGATTERGTRIGQVIATLHSVHPLITVDLRARVSQSTERGLESGELDVGVLLGRTTDRRISCYELRKLHFLVTGPAAWLDRIESADWVDLAQLPWLGPSGDSSTYSQMTAEIFSRRGLDLNVVVLFENAAHGRALLHAGMGVMLMQEEEALEGVRQGTLAVSRLARVEYSLSMAHHASRTDDPLIRAFVDVAREVWPEMQMHSTDAARCV